MTEINSAERSFSNGLLSALAADDLAALLPHLTRSDLPKSMCLEQPMRGIETVYFVEDGIVSIVEKALHHDDIEVGVIGLEGMTGIPVLLSNDRWPHSTFMQVGGWGHGITVKALRACMSDSAAMTSGFHKFVQSYLAQVSSTATARVRGNLEQRLSRWLLMADDRTVGRELHLTHEFLSMMLAVRRAGVTEAINVLEGEHLVKARRSNITIVSRAGLEQRAGVLYGAAEAEYERLIGRRLGISSGGGGSGLALARD